MELRAHAGVVKEPVAVAGTRSATMALIGVSYTQTFVLVILALVPAWFTLNPFWFLGSFVGLVALSRAASAGNPNRPREYWVALRTGSLWAGLRARLAGWLGRGNGWGGERVDVLAAGRPEAPPCP